MLRVLWLLPCGAEHMLHDLRLLLWLRLRHARTTLLYFVRALGADPITDRSFGERVYQVYLIAIIVTFAVLMWAALLSTITDVFAAIGFAGAAGVLSLALVVPVVVFVGKGVQGLRSSLLKLSHPDTTFVASSALGSRALVAEAVAASVLVGAACAAIIGYLLGVGLNSGIGVLVEPFVIAGVTAALVAAAFGGAWLLGVVRLAVVRTFYRRVIVVALALGLIVVALAAGAFWFGVVPALLATPSLFGVVGVGALAVFVVEVVGLACSAQRIDRATAIEESGLHADMQPFGSLSPLDPNMISDYRRSRKLARRTPHFHLHTARGKAALVAHAALSLVRQYEGMPSLLMLGVAVTPFGVCALLGMGEPITLLFWLMALVVMLPQGPREATRVFRDDMRIRLVRDQLPYSTLELLALDSLPAFAVLTLLSCVSLPFMLPAGAPIAAAMLLAVFINAAVLLSCGLNAIRLFHDGPRPWGEGGMIALVAVTAALSFAGSPLLLVGGAALVCLAIAGIIRGGVECIR